MKVDRTFTFRGSRGYLHSTSVFADLLQLRGADATTIDLKFHRRTAHQVAYTDNPDLAGRAVAEWHDAQGKLFIIERDEPIAERVPYDESRLADMLDVDGRMVRIPASTPGFTRFEALVAGFKRLLETAHTGARRKYAFVRIRLARVPEGAVEIRYARDIGTFFQGDISADGARLGQIFFGEWT
jgi:hypothetical protein